ncbi:MAG TPA: protein phosphatase CheZ [Alphaproteobacteria bacterium]|nr:protein phosphatase CheZ [Alphaproteobacteria bacterium]
MASAAAESALNARLDAARSAAGAPITREEVAEILTQVVETINGDLSAPGIKLYHELEALARYIQSARSEISAIRPDDIVDQHLPQATDELDAVVGATEEATGIILTAAETLMSLSGELPEDKSALVMDQVMKIFEASNFQDITGQRITKVVRTLKHIETKIDALLAAFGETARAAAPPAEAGAKQADKGDEASLLNGPQLPGNAIDQDEIDRLLASFD